MLLTAARDTCDMEQEFAATASLLGEPTRAIMLLKLLGGKALPAGELAFAANISPQTASGHLSRLVDARLLSVEQQGRHRYYRLADEDVAHAVEAMLALMPSYRRGVQPKIAPAVGTLPYARTCYSHLAGWLGVQLIGALLANGLLAASGNKTFVVTEAGRTWFEDLGVAIPKSKGDASARFARSCLDWSERTPHLAGALGVSLYHRMLKLGWVAQIPGSRAIRVTSKGKQELWTRLKLRIG
jgi:DNA-binding transcriptional ArsR family regulator